MYELPVPVKKDNFGWSVANYVDRQWFLKLQKEIFEAFNATSNQERAQELTDVITVCVSYLETLGFDQNARAELQRAVNVKNAARGYFKE